MSQKRCGETASDGSPCRRAVGHDGTHRGDDASCTETWHGYRCYLPAGHERGRHRAKETTALTDAFITWREVT